MKRKLKVTDTENKLIRHLPPRLKNKIRKALDEILEDPNAGKYLVEDLEGMRSYKIGRFRIVYRVEEASIIVISIGPRKSIYENIALEMKRYLENPNG